MNQNQSSSLFQAAQALIPGGVNSPVRAFGGVGGEPLFIESADGPYIFSADGDRYIDYIGSWGPMILGHRHPEVIQAVSKAVERGLSFGAPCEDEVRLAQLVVDMVPAIEKVRMVNSGTEAVMSALRLARGYTGRDKIIKFVGCYHGHADHLLVAAGSGAMTHGVPSSPGVTKANAQDTLLANYNDLASVAAHFEAYPDDIAAIVIEPVAGNMGVVIPEASFLKGLRELCTKHGTLLVIDEVMTGFRLAPGGACEQFGIEADLVTLGKIIGGGLPVGAFGGRAEIMQHLSPEGPVYQAGTLSGNPISMAAGIATLTLLRDNPSWYTDLATTTKHFAQALRDCAVKHAIPMVVNDVNAMLSFFFTDATEVTSFEDVSRADSDRFAKVFHGLLREGVMIAPSAYEAMFLSITHDQSVLDQTLAAFDTVFASI